MVECNTLPNFFGGQKGGNLLVWDIEKPVKSRAGSLNKSNQQQLRLDKKENLMRSFACSRSIKAGKKLDKKEMKQLIDELFACEKSFMSIDGKNTIVMLSMDEIKQLFK